MEPFLETTHAYARVANVEVNDIADDDLESATVASLSFTAMIEVDDSEVEEG
jgi:hypothetical protein